MFFSGKSVAPTHQKKKKKKEMARDLICGWAAL